MATSRRSGLVGHALIVAAVPTGLVVARGLEGRADDHGASKSAQGVEVVHRPFGASQISYIRKL